MGEDWRGDAGVAAYTEAALSNLDSPHPICIGKADDLIAAFMTGWDQSDHVSALKMLLLGWGSLRSATLVTRMGMTSQAPPIQRLALESIVYGILFCFDVDFHGLWLQRHDDPKALSKFKTEGFKRAMRVLADKSNPLHARTERLYQALIDLGAHPNVLSIEQISEYQIGENEALGRAQYYQLRGQPYVDMAHLNTALVYDVLIDSIGLIWPERSAKIGFGVRAPEVRALILGFLRSVRELSSN